MRPRTKRPRRSADTRPPLVRLSTSVRSQSLAVTVRRARTLARSLGITRVTDITRLDTVGVPVFASIRPDAQPGSLCVNAGKGLRMDEARVGAYMEAIEFAFAEYNRSGLPVVEIPAGQVYEGAARPESILDFCPQMGTAIPLDAALPCVAAEDIATGERFLVPAELVFLPFPATDGSPRYFGANSNGLASGNSVLEATVHGLAEVIERDICSFYQMDDDSALVVADTLPVALRRVLRGIERAGLTLYVRSVANRFGLPFFTATVVDEHRIDPVYVNGGQGCHPSPDVAVTRAVTEALQSRLSFIHGGRDDLTDTYARYAHWTPARRTRQARRIIARAARRDPSVRFDEVEAGPAAPTLSALVQVMADAVARVHATRILRVVYTARSLPLQVVRILVPGLEFFTLTSARVGHRLAEHVKHLP
jgi:ribosomal protein S12 methylthiotransferase accessory factor